ncbi:transport protein particle component [Lophiostoma macrostomum CBS 122681]|uniref:Transport protein particle component n=1 Tax=Lophiostoma macrostomum CBS 122681 TaxID=1314788 RepID=A0A6A6TGF4_9PLEO|nr:transport protein particle component [Lophiostoma macrostomum CBS 122681]
MATPQTPTDASLPYNDPTATLVNTSCLDFLLIELVPLAYRITADLAAREEEWLRGASSTSSSGSKPSRTSDDSSVAGTAGGRDGTVGGTVDEEEAREAVFRRLESLGYRVGLGVVERVSRTSPRPTSPLDTIKFLCKDLWTLLFRKQIDNLKTNHRGIYVLTDNTFKPMSRMSFDTKKHPPAAPNATSNSLPNANSNANPSSAPKDIVVDYDGSIGLGMGDPNSLARAQPFLYFPAGVIRGSLAALGIQASVTAESTGLPAATFQIRTVGAKA